ncbi:MAG: photosystem II reaction center X protein [Aphanocapsa lilacina HA4352-LM1]|jgi:photosystem II PsbX protein|uniref:Photosystem II reaction center protein X n=2 Tax=Gloeobacter TaxID=33071 RepID=PSBX_GLOVI|nr:MULTISPECIES: photosystem II reaction center X protein [Gloeobacter]Q7NJF8.1 RecName: Full=Photosystem II reaction center protein X [Gloeobacter violaceus PCC 7421]MBW4699602.1 photosystem II reaction center X protein [Aphanocapsa lilacina HA4352-LM1]UFP94850.1 photosystem II reaction center X protein [Gloeobacter morelensis MG652769]BAC89815.1 photosystem II protein [Gloeobacter violaceus PCC 7421]
MTATLSNFLWSIFWGGVVVALGAAALTAISRIDRIR